MKTKNNLKISFFSILVILAGALLLANVLLLDMTGKNFFAKVDFKKAEGVSIVDHVVKATRGTIYDSNGNVIASEKRVYKVIFILSSTHTKTVKNEEGRNIIVEDYVKDPRTTADKVAAVLGGDADYIYERLSMPDRYQVEIGTVGSNLDSETKQKLEDLDLPGMIFESSIRRNYPLKAYASHLVGYVSNNNVNGQTDIEGLGGIEGQLNTLLKGTDGKEIYYSDVNNNIVSGGLIESESPIDGYDVTLTLNFQIQSAIDEMLEKTMNIEDTVDKAWAVVMDAKTGQIYGYDSYPTFDPNVMDVKDYNDYCATLPYEPGSTMKSICYAAAIDLGHFDKYAMFNANNYYVGWDSKGNLKRVERSGLVIHNNNNRQWGMVNFERAYINSYNVGTVTLLEEQIGKENWERYIHDFGFFKPVDVYGIYEGDFYGTYNFGDVFSLACSSFGSGMSCTALQMCQAYTAFTNEGTMVKPYIVQSVTDKNTGEVVYQGGREEVGTPIKASTAAEMLDLMFAVVDSGLHPGAHTLRIDGVKIGCKTGTAPVINAQGVYSYEDVIHSVMICMPIDDPKLLIYVAYQDDQNSQRNFPFVKVLEQVCIDTFGLAKREASEEEVERKLFTMENLIGHTLEYAQKRLEPRNCELLVIGDGENVLRQYPLENSRCLTGQTIMLLTSMDNIVMPDMTGWSRNEVMAFWDLTGIGVKTEGYGYVTSQSIEPGTPIDKTVTIAVKFEEK